MNTAIPLDNPLLFQKIRQLSNRYKFKIIELTQDKEITITILAKEIRLAYTKCSDYCARLKSIGLVNKRKRGKEVLVKSNINVRDLSDVFYIKN